MQLRQCCEEMGLGCSAPPPPVEAPRRDEPTGDHGVNWDPNHGDLELYGWAESEDQLSIARLKVICVLFFLVRTKSVKLMNSWQQANSMPGSRTGRNWSLTWRSTVDRFGRLIHLRILWSSLMLIPSWEDVFCDGRNLESNDKALVKCWFSRYPNLSPSKTRLHCAFDNDRREEWHLVTSHLL